MWQKLPSQSCLFSNICFQTKFKKPMFNGDIYFTLPSCWLTVETGTKEVGGFTQRNVHTKYLESLLNATEFIVGDS